MSESLPVLKGAYVTLRKAAPRDVEAFVVLGNDPHIHEMFGGSRATFMPATPDSATSLVASLIDHPYAWIIERERPIGHARLDRVDLHDRRASFAIGILDPDELGKGYGTEAAKLVLRFAFGKLDLHRVSVRVLAYNSRAIGSYKKCGFVVEGREREAGLVNDCWHDDIIMGLLKREFI
ncbi:GNAT family N-acetyltransferase, partial [Rhodopseudomonas sp. B29]|uniref:GNAT family N-acetyltransferase n=1 Tax=Rhodopseudomonas sp. B29 TaxID=95607 RepID=UPI0003B62ABB